MLVEKKAEKTGFDIAFKNENFKCAFIKHSSAYSFGKVHEMKRHNKTDEIFVLLKGRAVMLTMEAGKFFETELAEDTAYSVQKGTWHYLALSEDAEAFVTENADTDAGNTDVKELEKEYVLSEHDIN